jgi:ubiquinone/menaquinone biosynthesis C-methylase UbiE
MNNPQLVAQQYNTDRHLQTRIRTHQLYSKGMNLEDGVDQALKLEPMESLLDIGTGPGSFPMRLREAGHLGRLVGMDFSSGMLEVARTKTSTVEWIQGNAMELPLSDSSFDLVTARHMLYHVPDMSKAIREAKRVLKPGGRFMAVTNDDGYMLEFWEAVFEAVKDDQDFNSMTGEVLNPKFFAAHLKTQIEKVFGNTTFTRLEGSLEFPGARPVLEYWDSIQGSYEISNTAWTRGRENFATVLENRFETGVWRVTKNVAIITAVNAQV